MNELVAVLAKNVRLVRKLRGLTQEQLAEHCGLSFGTIKALEIGKNWPRPESIEIVAMVLEISPQKLFWDDPLAGSPNTYEDTLFKSDREVSKQILKSIPSDVLIAAIADRIGVDLDDLKQRQKKTLNSKSVIARARSGAIESEI